MHRPFALPSVAAAFVVVLMAAVRAQLGVSTVPEVAGARIQTYNRRVLGSPGIRRVRLELQSRGVTTRSFEIAHAWNEVSDVVSSLVLMDAPADLRGTSYLWVEDPRTPPGLAIYLRLPAGKRRVLKVEPSRFDEGLLGSDFSYVDLLWRIPVNGRTIRMLGDAEVGGLPVTRIESRPATPEARESTAWERVEYSFSRNSDLLVAAEYFAPASAGRPAGPAAKSLSVLGWRQRDGVWAPSSMIMTRPGDQRSVMTLVSTKYRTNTLRPGLFDRLSLGTIAADLERGTSVEKLLERAR